MKNTFTPPILLTIINICTLLTLASCGQDEADSLYQELPYGEYPLQIGGVTLTVEPGTKVTENADGSASVWEGNEKIGVQIGNGTPGTYLVQADGSVVADQFAYWQSTAPTYINAWYPLEETVNLQDQSKRLAYVLNAYVDPVSYNQTVNLTFTHKLAKVRVVLSGTQAAQVTKVEVNNYTRCRNNQGTVVTQENNKGWITMHNVGDGVWEANVIPVTSIPTDFIRVNGQPATVTGLTQLSPAAMHTINLTVGQPITDLTPGNCGNITGDGHYRVSGSFGHTITITGGSPTIYLENANINVSSGNAIHIQSGNPTIRVQGTNNISSGNGAGIFVAEGSTVTITGRSREDVLTARGGNGGSGIGGNRATCGDIEISNMTVHAYGSDENGDYLSAGIGGSGNNGCGTITIDNATIFAYGASDGGAGNMSTPGIGGGLHGNGKGSYSTITIKNNSQVSVQRGSSRSDYIGSGGSTNNPANSPEGIDATVDGSSTVTKLN